MEFFRTFRKNLDSGIEFAYAALKDFNKISKEWEMASGSAQREER